MPVGTLRLGKKPATKEDRDIQFMRLVLAAPHLLKPAPRAFGFGTHIEDWMMLGNGPDDSVVPGFAGCGDCVLAGADHEHMLFAVEAKHVLPKFTGKTAVDDYAAVTGYDLSQTDSDGNNPTDQGTDVRDAMTYRKSTGIVDSTGKRHKIAAYVSVTAGDYDQLMLAAFNFLAVGIGFEFPDSAMEQFDNGEPWDVVRGAQIEGGHYVVVTGRKSADDIGVITWAKRQSMTRAFFEKYTDEVWAFVSEDELAAGKTVRGYDLTTLQTALRELS
jgi:hypothetical protein